MLGFCFRGKVISTYLTLKRYFSFENGCEEANFSYQMGIYPSIVHKNIRRCAPRAPQTLAFPSRLKWDRQTSTEFSFLHPSSAWGRCMDKDISLSLYIRFVPTWDLWMWIGWIRKLKVCTEAKWNWKDLEHRVILSEKLELRKMRGEGLDFLGLRMDLEYPEKWKTICPPKPWLRYLRLRQFIDLIAYFIYQTVSFPRFGRYQIQVSFWSVSKEGNIPH